MEKAFKEMVFEWEYLHPKGSVNNKQELSPTEMIPVAGKELEDEQAIFSDEKLVMDEVLTVEEEITCYVKEEETDCGLQSLLFEEEEEDVGKNMVEFEDPEIKENDEFEAFKLKKWLRSVVMAAATVSIFILGGGRVQLTGRRKNIQSGILKENVKDFFVQHQKAASTSFSLSGHYDERF